MLVRSNRIHAGGGPKGGRRVRALAAAGLLLPLAVLGQGGEDDYLLQIQQEALKVDEQAGGQPGSESSLSADVSIEQFEKELKGNYRGSFMFYTKLPRRSREEIFLDYRKGASIEEIRQKIMNRFMHEE